MMPDPAERFRNKRSLGVVDRAVKLPLDSEENERMAFEAERFFGELYGLEARDDVIPGGDESDFTVGGKKLDVKWTPRKDGRLICYLGAKPCDIYVLVVGQGRDMRVVGWATRQMFVRSIQDLGHGPTYALDQGELMMDVGDMVETLRGQGGVRKTEEKLEVADFL